VQASTLGSSFAEEKHNRPTVIMLIWPILSVLVVYALTYVPFFLRMLLVGRKSNNIGFNKLNAREGGRDQLFLREAMDDHSFKQAGRLQAAHENSLESLGIYAAGIAAALATDAKKAAINTFASIFVVARILYTIIYALPPIAGGLFRTLLFAISVLCK
jgi:uncharacterized MAPEG superfamily protein